MTYLMRLCLIRTTGPQRFESVDPGVRYKQIGHEPFQFRLMNDLTTSFDSYFVGFGLLHAKFMIVFTLSFHNHQLEKDHAKNLMANFCTMLCPALPYPT